MAAVIGNTDDGGTGIGEGASLGAVDLGADSHAPVEEQQPVDQSQVGPEGQVSETDVTALDLTQPEHIKEFRSSYDRVKYEREQERVRADQVTQELEAMRASQGKGVYLATDVPLEDFNPREGLTRMMEEEPEYYEAVAADFMEAHFWPDLKDQLGSIDGVQLNPDDPRDAEKLEALGAAWDVMARRMTAGQLNGDMLYRVLDILENSPEAPVLQQIIVARLSGQQPTGDWQSASPAAPADAWGQSQGYGLPARDHLGQQQVQGAEAIAQQFGLDPTEPQHAQLIRQIQADQYSRAQMQLQTQREIAQRDMRLQQMQDRLDALAGEQKKIGQTGSQEAERRAETRLNEQLESSLDSDIQTRYASAVPKDRPALLGDIKTIAKAALEANAEYKSATAKAAKWFKQASVASNPGDRDRWDKAGLDCLAVVSVHRANAIRDAAERLLGPIRRTTQRGNQRTQQLQGARREFTGGTNVPPVSNRQPAPTGDIEATRAAIKERWRQSQGQR